MHFLSTQTAVFNLLMQGASLNLIIGKLSHLQLRYLLRYIFNFCNFVDGFLWELDCLSFTIFPIRVSGLLACYADMAGSCLAFLSSSLPLMKFLQSFSWLRQPFFLFGVWVPLFSTNWFGVMNHLHLCLSGNSFPSIVCPHMCVCTCMCVSCVCQHIWRSWRTTLHQGQGYLCRAVLPIYLHVFWRPCLRGPHLFPARHLISIVLHCF